ncbi:hypothetical protein GGTG_00024 [Gaeumannomyces tritici R3-111a-1]|uniref:WW domain-containing protein n=1 Tax=Gaeumannomyces tritici (strain R3-111a-1) TaxID=644352 RepID=J3NFH8_GAET3|nr:hypothetical protein GGTG_00024 [Gaeumannomyces tritici R3-111a-1]EJT80018.1 hypothetical protein GGTG_00024 [Gaeumannomyces tritici R3-111a-1]
MDTATTMENTNKPSLEELEKIKPSTRDLAVPDGYTEHFTENGVAYYCQHATRTVSHLHPAKFRVLQAAGVLDASASDLPAFALELGADNYPVPERWERRRDEKGRAYYLNHELKTTQWEHPEYETVIEKAHGKGRWGEPSGTGGKSKFLREWEEDYTSRGVLPPWILEETTAPPPPEGSGSGSGGLEPQKYWVNYKTGSKSQSQSPFDAFEARTRNRERTRQGLPMYRKPKVKM